MIDDPLDAVVGHPLLGMQVAVRLDDEGKHWVDGVLLKLTVSGEADVLQDDGRTNYCWPALEIVRRHTRMVSAST